MSDSRNASTPAKCRYRHNESGADRHARRLRYAVELIPKVVKWTIKVGINLTIRNNNNHWTWETMDGKNRADWWPSSAKLVVNRDFTNTIHAHDPGQVARELVKLWGIDTRKGSHEAEAAR